MDRTYVSVSRGQWKQSARKFSGVPAEVLSELLANVTDPQGQHYTLIPTASDSLTFVAETFSVLLNGPIPWSAVPFFETSLENALKPFLGESE